MLASRLAIIALCLFTGKSSARNVPGPGDPDTYPGKTIKYEVSPGVVIEEPLDVPPENITVTKDDIKIFFHCNSQPAGVELDIGDPWDSLEKTDFKPTRMSFFVIHGWKNDHASDIFKIIKNALLHAKDVNLFIVDWSKIAKRSYPTARVAVADVGNLVGGFIQAIVDGNHLDLDKTQIVGHSLGAHISGFAGATLGGKTNTIIGLDPAWPSFHYSRPQQRLNDHDAKSVQVIHTSGKIFGIPYSIGTSDFYPNGGKSQPGCFLDPIGTCAHSISYKYYGESLETGNFVSWKCTAYSHFKQGQCKNNPKANMGEYDPNVSARGDFYLDTNTQAPFAQGG